MTLFYDQELDQALAERPDVVDLFAGPGGWSEALHQLGLADIGIEFERWACSTRRAAGHPTIEADITHLEPGDYIGPRGLIASPPCQTFSAAGKRTGRDLIPDLIEAIASRHWGARPARDPRVWLALEVGRWYEAIRPEWIALEQVPAVLPLWHAYAEIFTADGYSTWTGTLNAADYGVPQTRQRAILIASRSRPVDRPPPTHTRDQWVSMAAALGWDGRVGFPRLDDRGDSPDGYRERDWRDTSEPSFAVTEKARSWVLNTGRDWTAGGTREDAQTLDMTDRPAPAVTAKSGGQWQITGAGGANATVRSIEEPAPTRAGSEAIRLSIRDALILQSFRPDYPVQGTKTKQFEQIGNAIPPLLATHVLRSVI